MQTFQALIDVFLIRQTVTVEANYYEEPVRNACNLFNTQQSHILYLGVTHYIRVYRLLPLSDAFWYFIYFIFKGTANQYVYELCAPREIFQDHINQN